MPAYVKRHAVIDDVLAQWREQLGPDFDGYRGHVYRIFNYCRTLHGRQTADDTIAAAAVFHDLGIWADGTFDYLEPSVARADAWLREQRPELDAAQIAAMIRWHHKLRACGPDLGRLTELFRRADLVDVSWGLVKFGLSRRFLRDVKHEFPNAGFHRCLLRIGGAWFIHHPLRPLPMMKW